MTGDSGPAPALIDALAALGTPRTYPRNTVLVQEGDRSDQLYVVLAGRLKAYLDDGEGREIILDVLGPGRLFGEMALDGEPRSASVMTLESTRLAVVQRADFQRFLAREPEAAFQFILVLIGRARHLTRSVGNLALLDVYGRVARFLIDHAIDEGGRQVVRGPGTQQEIARRINASREMVSRVLTDLRDGGYITIDDGAIVLRQRLPKRW